VEKRTELEELRRRTGLIELILNETEACVPVTLDKVGANPLDSIYYRGRVVVTEVEITLALLDSIYLEEELL